MAFSDIHPAAVEHILVIPRRHVPSFHHLQPTEEDRALGKWCWTALSHRPLCCSCQTGQHPASHPSLEPRAFLNPTLHHAPPPAVEAMVARGQAALQELRPGAEQTKCGFHLPPLILVNHLHLHCMVLPHTAWWRGLLFAPWAPWWLGAADALRRLAR